MPLLRGHPPPPGRHTRRSEWVSGASSQVRGLQLGVVVGAGGGYRRRMAAPGWYPDPSGQRGPRGMRYWDGQRWVDAIPAAPRHPSGVNWVVWLVAGGAMLVLLVIGAVVADMDKPKDVASRPSSTVRAPSLPTIAGSPIPPSPGEAYKIGGFGSPWLEGVYEAPGGVACSWVVQRDLAGDESSVIRRGRGVAGERARVALRDGEYFTSDGCGTWQRVGGI